MSINVNNVYTTVLSILNKEQRGDLTPDNFNKAARQAQLAILEKTIYEYNRAINEMKSQAVNEDLANKVAFMREKLESMARTANVTLSSGVGDLSTLDYFEIIDVVSSDRTKPWEEIDKSRVTKMLASPLTSPSANFPVYYLEGSATDLKINALPDVDGVKDATVKVNYLGFPKDPRWGYIEDVEFGTFVYDPNVYDETKVILGNIFTTFTQNITNGIDGTYPCVGAVQGGTVNVNVTVQGNIVTSVELTEELADRDVGDTITVGTIVSTLNNTDIPVSAPSATDLIITLTEDDFYGGTGAGSTDFELHPSEENNLVLEILALSGVVIRDLSITQLAGSIAQTNEIEKQ